MARPKAPAEQQIKAYHFYKQGFSAVAILIKLELLEGDSAVSIRTVRYWIADFKKMPDEATRLDDPFEWCRMDEYNIPWQGSRILLSIWRFAVRGSPGPILEQIRKDLKNPEIPFDEIHIPISPEPLRLPTVRQVGWWCRVFHAAPNLCEADIYWLAQRFAVRELGRDVLGIPSKFDDLEAFIAFAPWQSAERNEEYLQSIEDGTIPQMRADNFSQSEWESLAQAAGWNISHLQNRLVPRSTDVPYLYSQKLKMVAGSRRIRRLKNKDKVTNQTS